jgi:hypothetical protein
LSVPGNVVAVVVLLVDRLQEVDDIGESAIGSIIQVHTAVAATNTVVKIQPDPIQVSRKLKDYFIHKANGCQRVAYK